MGEIFCEVCNGEGEFEAMDPFGSSGFPEILTCYNCKGKGVLGDKCHKCGGTGRIVDPAGCVRDSWFTECPECESDAPWTIIGAPLNAAGWQSRLRPLPDGAYRCWICGGPAYINPRDPDGGGECGHCRHDFELADRSQPMFGDVEAQMAVSVGLFGMGFAVAHYQQMCDVEWANVRLEMEGQIG